MEPFLFPSPPVQSCSPAGPWSPVQAQDDAPVGDWLLHCSISGQPTHDSSPEQRRADAHTHATSSASSSVLSSPGWGQCALTTDTEQARWTWSPSPVQYGQFPNRVPAPRSLSHSYKSDPCSPGRSLSDIVSTQFQQPIGSANKAFHSSSDSLQNRQNHTSIISETK